MGLYIGVAVGVLLIIIGILRQVDWFNVFNKFYGNDPRKGKIYVDFGENELFYDGIYLYSDDKWLYYDYEIGKNDFTVAVPVGWEFVFVRGRRKILVDFGSEHAKPLSGKDKIPSAMGAALLNASIKKKLAVDMVNSIESHKGLKMGMVLLVVALLAVAMVWWWQSSKEKPVMTNEPVTTQNVTSQNTPEEQLIIDQMKGGK